MSQNVIESLDPKSRGEERIREMMGEDKSGYERKIKTESEWGKLLNYRRSPTFIEKIKSFLNS